MPHRDGVHRRYSKRWYRQLLIPCQPSDRAVEHAIEVGFQAQLQRVCLLAFLEASLKIDAR